MSEDYRALAQRNLNAAVAEIMQIPNGQVRTDEMIARSAKTQAVATIAIAQAVLHLGDVITKAMSTTQGDGIP